MNKLFFLFVESKIISLWDQR